MARKSIPNYAASDAVLRRMVKKRAAATREFVDAFIDAAEELHDEMQVYLNELDHGIDGMRRDELMQATAESEDAFENMKLLVRDCQYMIRNKSLD